MPQYVDDSSLTWEERYKRLEAHHLAETRVLLDRIADASVVLDGLRVERSNGEEALFVQGRAQGTNVELSGKVYFEGGGGDQVIEAYNHLTRYCVELAEEMAELKAKLDKVLASP